MYLWKIFLIAVCASTALALQTEDPLCVLKGCPSDKPCRVVTECPSQDSCTLRAECMDNPPKSSHTGVCQIGQPILVMWNGTWNDTQCGPSLPCPNDTYCNTELMDTYATCCRSDPANTVKPGQCPVSNNNDTFYCSDSCSNDGDCRGTLKCCQDGCRRVCVPPQREDICPIKKCPEGTYCQTDEMPPCIAPGKCFTVGDCVPCASTCDPGCDIGHEKDSFGCPVCQCTPPLPDAARKVSLVSLLQRQNADPTAGSRSSFLWMLFWNKVLF